MAAAQRQSDVHTTAVNGNAKWIAIRLASMFSVFALAAVVSGADIPSRTVSLPWVLGQLRREAASSWFQDRTFPRTEADFATEHHVSVAEDELVRVLARHLHRDPAIESYIKWQQLVEWAKLLGEMQTAVYVIKPAGGLGVQTLAIPQSTVEHIAADLMPAAARAPSSKNQTMRQTADRSAILTAGEKTIVGD